MFTVGDQGTQGHQWRQSRGAPFNPRSVGVWTLARWSQTHQSSELLPANPDFRVARAEDGQEYEAFGELNRNFVKRA